MTALLSFLFQRIIYIYRERERERQTEREKERETERETEMETGRSRIV